MCGTTFLGIIIATFFYISYGIRRGDKSLIRYSLKASYFGDGIIFVCAFTQFITATILVSVGKFTLAVPWICVAYLAFSGITLLWLINLFIKRKYFANAHIKPFAFKIFYFLNILIILTFMVVIHDAVTQSTWLDFLFRQ